MVLCGGIILWWKWLVLWIRRKIVLFCPHFWSSRIGLGGTPWNGWEQEQARAFFGRPRNTAAPSAIYFSVPVIMEQGELPTALEGSLPQQPHCLPAHQPCIWGGLAAPSPGATSAGWRPQQTWWLQIIMMQPTQALWCHGLTLAPKCSAWSVYKC